MNPPSHRVCKHSCGRRGSSIVEFAIGAGVLLAVFVGTFQFGYTFIRYNRLQTAVAQGARYASLLPYDSATASPTIAFSTAVKNMVLYGSPTQGASPVVSDLAPGNVNLRVTFGHGIPRTVTVSITGYTIDALFGTFALTDKPIATYPFQSIWAPI